MRFSIIGNKIAGRGHSAKRVEELRRCLEQRGHHVDILQTAHPGHASELAAQVNGNADAIVAAGGDGTLMEVLNGLRDPAATPLAQLPVGTANILARELRLPTKPQRMTDMLEQMHIRKLDLGLAGNHRFLSVLSSGFDAMVVKEVQARRTGTLGFTGYVKPIIDVLRRYRVPTLHVTVDDQEPMPAALVIVSNIRRYAGIMTVTRNARCDSGHLDVCILPKGSLLWLIRYGLSGLIGRVTTIPGVKYITGKNIRIESTEPVPVEVDGEYFGNTTVDVTIQPQVVPFIVNGNR